MKGGIPHRVASYNGPYYRSYGRRRAEKKTKDGHRDARADVLNVNSMAFKYIKKHY
ncbi:hypothetical protein E2C01_080873 [Portunus trituberculatus]|uniref:Uncharacterized protein n=1 Tax=Portunus trituberculatus TaxID=210409 RepID=A0A5B7IKS0_PORTR|nr:hypothetical protein [Portunus trituberculatus]